MSIANGNVSSLCWLAICYDFNLGLQFDNSLNKLDTKFDYCLRGYFLSVTYCFLICFACTTSRIT